MNTITEHSFLPDVIGQYPATRSVFDRYGLHGCGGPAGPRETVGWFSRLHAVPLERLLTELNEAALQAQPQYVETRPSLADTIFRPFFLAGIATIFSVGCFWGAINLWIIGHRGAFGGVSYSWVLAHADAMVFGFVGLFVMGFGYQAFPRFKHSTLWRPGLAWSTLPLMLSGVWLQTVAHLGGGSRGALWLGAAAGLLQLAAVIIFAIVIRQTLRRAGKPEPYDRFVFAALGWFIAAAIANPLVFWLFEGAQTREQFVAYVSSFDVPYRDVELLGMAVVMILGVSLKFLPHAYGFREPSRRWRGFMFWGVNAALACSVITFIGAIALGQLWMFLPNELCAVVLLIVAAVTPGQFRLFGKVHASERDRGVKFIRAAYAWFAVAMAMLVFAPIYDIAIYMPLTQAQMPFSHAFLGAYRHALTVGFILMMIVGVSSKVVPTLSGVDLQRAASLWPTLVLLNFGNALRIATQIATDFTPSAYGVMGISGFIEVTGLALWGWEMFRNIRFGKRLADVPAASVSPISELHWAPGPHTRVGEVLERYPHTLSIFLSRGFAPLSNPALRKTVARIVTLEQVCRRESVDLDSLLDQLRSSIEASRGPVSSGGASGA